MKTLTFANLFDVTPSSIEKKQVTTAGRDIIKRLEVARQVGQVIDMQEAALMKLHPSL